MEVAEYFVNAFAARGGDSQEMGQLLQSMPPGAMLNRVWLYIMGSLIFGYFINLSAAWYAGTLWGSRLMGRYVTPLRPVDFYVPDFFIWPLIFSWAAVLASYLVSRLPNAAVSLKAVEIVAWNTGLVFLLLFGMQGLGIIRVLMSRYQIARRIRPIWIALAILIVLFRPLTVAFLVLVPGLGVSEIWIKHRQTRNEKGEEE
jgi:hypothetical protein